MSELRDRLIRVLGRHVREEDTEKSDDDFVRELFKRYEYWRSQPLIDPAE